jgi:hypothetical protein
MHHLQRHVKRWCPENDKRERVDEDMEEDQSPTKWISFETEENDKEEEDDRQHEVFNFLMKRTKQDNAKV